MEKINLNKNWRYTIAIAGASYYEPTFDDRDWPLFTADTQLSTIQTGEALWLRCRFEMPPNDECSYWWLELRQNWPVTARIWVNYEALPLPPEFSPAKWEMTYAIAMGENIVTLQLQELVTANLWQNGQCVPYPCD